MFSKYKMEVGLWQILLCIMVVAYASANNLLNDDDPTSICRLFKNNTIIRLRGICDAYVQCAIPISEVYYCNSPDGVYDFKQGKCVKDLRRKQECKNPCAHYYRYKVKANNNNCKYYYLCSGLRSHYYVCKNGYHFDEEAEICVPESESPCVENINICEFVADQTMFLNESDGSKYFKCENGKLLRLNCQNQYFNVEAGKCEEKSSIKTVIQV